MLPAPSARVAWVEMGTAYVHCAGCKKAFDAASCPRCPSCRRRLGRPSLEDRVLDAIEEIERAMVEATVEERASLEVALGRKFPRALPAVTTLVEVAPPKSRRDDWAMIATSVVSGLARRMRAVFA